MQTNPIPQKGEAFRAKLRHYHRSASPEFFSRKRKRWENLSQEDLSDSSLAQSIPAVRLDDRKAGN